MKGGILQKVSKFKPKRFIGSAPGHCLPPYFFFLPGKLSFPENVNPTE
jgi:hypothetical protein